MTSLPSRQPIESTKENYSRETRGSLGLIVIVHASKRKKKGRERERDLCSTVAILVIYVGK